MKKKYDLYISKYWVNVNQWVCNEAIICLFPYKKQKKTMHDTLIYISNGQRTVL